MPPPQPESVGTEPTPRADMFSVLASAPSLDIAGATRRIGTYVWLMSRLFEIAGHWASEASDPGLKRRLAGVSTRFAWQAAEWHRRLPRLREVDPEAVIQPPDRDLGEALDQLAVTSPQAAEEPLMRVLWELDVVYATHAAGASPVADGPVLRSLERIRADLVAAQADLRTVDPPPE